MLLESSIIKDEILTIEANQRETKVVLKDPAKVTHLFATEIRLRTLRPKKLEFPFYRETPPMTPNLERYGVSTFIPQGLSPERVISYFTTYY